MVGIVPGQNQSFEVYGDLTSNNLVEGKLYYSPNTQRLYYYSTTETRSSPRSGWFPIWNGSTFYVSNFSNAKFFDKDAIKTDITTMCLKIDKSVADQVRYNQRRSDNDEILKPVISDKDNMFTQVVKGVIQTKKVTMIDLVDMSREKLTEKEIDNFYNALTKITFMRIDKWNVWIDIILHLKYVIRVFKNGKTLVVYYHPEDKFDTGVVKYDDIIKTKSDPFKRIIKVLMVMENINKQSLKSDQIDDYTINNMMTTINGDKPLSAQLFSRFIRIAGLTYTITMHELDGTQIFEFKE